MSERSEATRRAIGELTDLVKIPSVSPRAEKLEACAASVEALLGEAGFRTEICPGEVGPFVVAEMGQGPFILLIYNHYDVQPEDPVELWSNDPFELTERDGRLYGRGAADDKGEFISRLAGWRLFREANPEPLPFRLIWIVEGEEEIGSPSLDRFLQQRFPELKADLCWWEFGEIDSAGRPVILMGFKGVLAIELECRTARADLHSSFGAIFDNPLWRLSSAIASMRDASGRILIDNFYDSIDPVERAAEDLVSVPPYSLAGLQEATGGSTLLRGIDGVTFYRHLNLEPCLNINGIHGGYGGEGAKTVLPAFGVAKLDFRLVPGQEPLHIVQLVRKHLDKLGFADIKINVLDAEVRAVRSDPAHWAVALGVDLLGRHFGKEPIIQPSSPASGLAYPFVQKIGATLFGAGLTHHGAMLHSPDENILIEHLEKMIAFSADFFAGLAEKSRTLEEAGRQPAETAS